MTADERRVLWDLEEDKMMVMVERAETEERNRFVFS